MSEGDASGGSAGGVGGDEEAAWRDLIARYEMPVDSGAAPVPWPEREDLAEDPAADGTGGAGETSPDKTGGHHGGREAVSGAGDSRPGADSPEPRPGEAPGAGRTRVIRQAAQPPPDPAAPAAGLASPAAGRAGGAGEPAAEDDTGEHYIPPPPPPLPHLDPVAKGAWAALFGGPGYLFIATLAGSTVPSWAALLAVAAFIIGFAVIVLRLGDRPSRGDGPDNGAVLLSGLRSGCSPLPAAAAR